MRIGTAGIVTNEYNHILLIQRDDTRTWCEPGGSLEFGRLPDENAAAEIREETGMIVMPIRLVALHYISAEPDGALGFIFRCLIRGGEPTPSPESLQVGFFASDKLPRPILDFHKQSIYDGWHHKGGPVIMRRREFSTMDRVVLFMLRKLIYPIKNRRRQRNGDAYTPAPAWTMTVNVVVQNEAGDVLWITQGNSQYLPHGVHQNHNEAPWETAVRVVAEQANVSVKIHDAAVVTVKKDSTEMTLSFAARLQDNTTQAQSLFSAEIPAAAHPADAEIVRAALNDQEETIFRYESS